MSAISMIVTPSAVHLITDAAFYNETGVVVQVRSKVTASPHHRMAVACTGRCDRNRIAARLMLAPGQRQALRWAEDAVMSIRAENDLIAPTDGANGLNDVMLFIAAWSEEHGEPRGWVCSSTQAHLGEQYRPYSMVDVLALSSPPVAQDLFQPADPAASAGRILDAQRLEPSWHGPGIASVGGFGELTTIDRHGINQTRVREWPDQIGQQIRI